MNKIKLQYNDIALPSSLANLREIACNFWWSWNPKAQSLFREIDPEHWNEFQNPVKLILETDEPRISALADNQNFCQRVNEVHADLITELSRETWLQANHPDAADKVIVYLCAEYGIHESLPIYSGGLGVLAGDHTKSASDLGIRFIGIGLLYRNGYFRQEIDADGNQHAVYLQHNFETLPVQKILSKADEPLIIRVALPEREVAAQVWLAQVGRSILLLLDTDVEQNLEPDRKITAELYGGDREMRIMQEIVLGIGGVKLIRALELNPSVWHLNEGHVAFSILERVKEFMQEKQFSFRDAVEAVRATTVFTTHTPVPAGNEAFSIPLIDKYFRHYCKSFGLNLYELTRLGLQERMHGEKFFSMTVFALRMSCISNGVSALHGDVSRKIWSHLWPEIPCHENPITSITNGVHTQTWIAPEMADLFEEVLGRKWKENLGNRDFWQQIYKVSDEQFRKTKRLLKENLFAFIRERLRWHYQRLNAPQEKIAAVQSWLNPDVLTIGFARRFATYKRATLIFRDFDRLNRIINNPERPVQLIFAGKAHPADQLGQALIREIWRVSQTPEFSGKIVLLENYDIRIGRKLVQGVDLWLNNPRRPQEASGTSGQKVPINSGVNFSVLDGWWPEAYNGENGWKIGQEQDYSSEETQDHEDAYSIYNILENEIIPLYYAKEGEKSWESVVKASMATTLPVFNTEMMVRKYFEKMYQKAIANANKIEQQPKEIANLISQKTFFRENWPVVHFTAVRAHIDRAQGYVEINADLYLGELKPENVAVELYCVDGHPNGTERPRIFPLEAVGSHDANIIQYALTTHSGLNGDADYRLRVLPQNDAFSHKHELGLIYWKDLD
jgi:starch phosphorylase